MIAALLAWATKRLAAVTLTPKTLGVVALLWLASLGGLYAYMAGHATSLAETAAATALAKCNGEKAEAAKAALEAQTAAITKARADWQAAQDEVDRIAKADRERIEGELIAARVRADNLFRILQGHIHAKPLPADCRLDAERVRLFNAARRPSSAASD